MNNLERPTPIDKEVTWDKTQTIMSKTDPKGIIEYANDIFIEVSGYEEFELIGQPHNVIRHPDMPKIIFKTLWDRIQKGENMHAIVKNLCKSGRYYWVITDFKVKFTSEGEIDSYVGTRKAAPKELIEVVQPLYSKLLHIEKASGLEASEKYFKGFLEDKGKSYDAFLDQIMTLGEKKSFFRSFFSKK